MIVDVTFRYAAKLIPFQKRNPIDVRFLDTIPVEIRELGEVEAPLAFRFVDPERYLDPGEAPPENSVIDVRKVDDGLFEPFILRDSATAPYARMTGPALVDAARNAYLSDMQGFDPFGTATKRYWDADSSIQDFPRSKPVSSERDATIQAIHNKASKLLLIEGRLYKSTTEPVYYQRGMGRGYVTIARLSLNLREETKSYRSIFRADEFEQIQMRGESPDDVANRIEVVDPTAITFRGPELAMIEQASAVLESLKGSLPTTTVEKFTRYVNLREALRLAEAEPAGPTQDAIDAVVSALRPIQERDLADSYWMSLVDRALARLDASAMRTLTAEGFSP